MHRRLEKPVKKNEVREKREETNLKPLGQHGRLLDQKIENSAELQAWIGPKGRVRDAIQWGRG
jgi:hypothetical protein